MEEIVAHYERFMEALWEIKKSSTETGSPFDQYYRYRSAQTPYFLEEIERALEGQFYFASLDQVNDPFDCRPVIDRTVTFAEFKDHIYPVQRHIMLSLHFGSPLDMNREEFRAFKKRGKAPNAVVKKSFEIDFEEDFLEAYQRQRKMLCLTKDPSNNVMWSMYASRFDGYLFELSDMVVIHSGSYLWQISKIQYSKKRAKINYRDMIAMMCFDSQDFLYRLPKKLQRYLMSLRPNYSAYETKELRWSYEEEYRLETAGQPNYAKLARESLKSITLGHELSADKRQQILDLIAAKRPDLPIYETQLSRERFDVVRSRVK